jgi:putative peptide zinc metalloprotease protein
MSNSPSTSPQRIAWKRRADLQIVPLEFGGECSWGVKDPVALSYFELRDEEYFVLRQIDGQASVAEVCARFQQRFRPLTLSPEELQRFVGQLISQGLLVAEGPGYGRALAVRRNQSLSQRRLSRFSNLLSIRFQGIDPDRILDWLLQRTRWLFTRPAIFTSLLLMLSALLLVVVQFDRVIERLPDSRALLTPVNLIWLPALLTIVKILHELGHGLTCKRFGGECRELGVMLLVGTPTLYCNVSDMWMVRSKWKRIAVSAAGMWVEAVIASTCTLLWWFSAPGLFNSTCLNLMFICGVSTFLFNGNPLLRYDGYFVLTDLVEIPNLQQQAAARIRGALAWWFCGIRDRAAAMNSTARRWLLFGYGVASAAYRLLLTFLILWTLHYWLEPYGMAVVVQILGAPILLMMVFSPIAHFTRFVKSPENRDRIHWPRFRLRLLLACVALVALLTVPLPYSVDAGALIDQDTAQRVYATLGGTLEEGVDEGRRVEAGQQIARLVDPKIESELTRLEGEYRQHELRLKQLELRRISDPDVAALIPAVREATRDLQSQWSQLKETAERLVVRAPSSGIVLRSPWQSGASSHGQLPGWRGTPLDPRNRGCFVKSGTTLCLVGPIQSRIALALVSQDDINLIRVNQTARFLWRELAGEIQTGKVLEIAALDLDMLPADAARRLNLPTRPSAEGGLAPIGTWYLVRIQLEETDTPILRGAAGRAKIATDPQSLATRSWRWIRRTFPL